MIKSYNAILADVDDVDAFKQKKMTEKENYPETKRRRVRDLVAWFGGSFQGGQNKTSQQRNKKPNPRQNKNLEPKVIPGHQALSEGDDRSLVLQPVQLKRIRSPPTLPEINGSISQDQIKLRDVLQSLINSETNYMKSLERVTKAYKNVMEHVKKQEFEVTFQNLEEIVAIHQMFTIELSHKLKEWNEKEEIGSVFRLFSREKNVDIYSTYVNNYEVSCEEIQEAENSIPAFRDSIRKEQSKSQDTLSLPGLMIKPVQRFPQYIMIIKDLLKYTPRDHHDREELQEAITCIENVAHQLNERKRQSEQLYHGQQIMAKLHSRMHPDKSVFLNRQDAMEQISKVSAGSQSVKRRRLFLMNDRLIVTTRKGSVNSEKYVYKWHQNLLDLDLTTSAITPDMQTAKCVGMSSSIAPSHKTENLEDDHYSYNVESELQDAMHDVSVLADINNMVDSLKLTYPSSTKESLETSLKNLQKYIQTTSYQLQTTILLQDIPRRNTYIFRASSPVLKQQWCIDFLMGKYALEAVNNPGWHKQDSTDTVQPAIFMKKLSVDMQQIGTRISCGVKVYFPMKSESSVERLWVCSSTDSHGQVSIVSLHTDKPSLIESFQTTMCEILCVENVDGCPVSVQNTSAFEEDTVWMSTANAEIQVFKLSEKDPELHRQCAHVFSVGRTVISMQYKDYFVFCGHMNGDITVIERDKDGVWNIRNQIQLGTQPVISMIVVGDNLWAACGNEVFILDMETLDIDKKRVTNEEKNNFQYLVKIGAGVWASFVNQPKLCLYHSESGRFLQEVNISTAVRDFIKVYSGIEEHKNFQVHVTSLTGSLGFLWIGTNVGIIIVYPLPRLRDGVPRINERPIVALHSHNGPVKFLIPVPYGGSPVKRQRDSVLRKYYVDDSSTNNRTGDRNSARSESTIDTISKDNSATGGGNLHEEIEFKEYQKESESEIHAEIQERKAGETSERIVNKTEHSVGDDIQGEGRKSSPTDTLQSDEQICFTLERHEKENSGSVRSTKEQDRHIYHEATNSGSSEAVKIRKSSLNRYQSTTLSTDSSKRTMCHASVIQTECAQKVKHLRYLKSPADGDETQDEVGNLYPILVRPTTLPVRYVWQENLEGSQEILNSRAGFRNPVLTRKPDMPSTANFSLPPSTKEESLTPEVNKEKPMTGSGKSVSQTMENETVGTSFSNRLKEDSHNFKTIMLLSGGDGYKDWKNRESLPNIPPEEPFLMFWMYRI